MAIIRQFTVSPQENFQVPDPECSHLTLSLSSFDRPVRVDAEIQDRKWLGIRLIYRDPARETVLEEVIESSANKETPFRFHYRALDGRVEGIDINLRRFRMLQILQVKVTEAQANTLNKKAATEVREELSRVLADVVRRLERRSSEPAITPLGRLSAAYVNSLIGKNRDAIVNQATPPIQEALLKEETRKMAH